MQKQLKELGRLYLGNQNNDQSNAQKSELKNSETHIGLPLLQIWPSDSPRKETSETKEQSFIYPEIQENVNDSGIDSIQASPSPCSNPGPSSSPTSSPHPSRRPSLLHPDHARLQLHNPHHHHHHHQHHLYLHNLQSRRDSRNSAKGFNFSARSSIDDDFSGQQISPTSSTGSLKSVPSSVVISIHSAGRRRSSRYSMFDPLDLEYALIRAASTGRGSIGRYSLSESLHKLTFTQSLAFPALAAQKKSTNIIDKKTNFNYNDNNMNLFAKIVTAFILIIVSILVFGVIYKIFRS